VNEDASVGSTGMLGMGDAFVGILAGGKKGMINLQIVVVGVGG